MRSIIQFGWHWVATAAVLGGMLESARGQIPYATEPFSRKNKVEFYGVGQYLHQGETKFPDYYGGTTKLTLKDTGLGGFGVAGHFSDFFSVRGDFLFGPATFKTAYPEPDPYTLTESGSLQTGRINLDYNMINRRLSPVLTAGIGYQWLGVNQDRYYYPYYYDSYYDEVDFTWNVGAGVRWNVTDNLFIKVMGGAQWLQYEGAKNITTQFEAFFVIGWTIP